MHLANPKKTIRMQFENISIDCENGHIVESCEIIAAAAPSAGCGSIFALVRVVEAFMSMKLHFLGVPIPYSSPKAERCQLIS